MPNVFDVNDIRATGVTVEGKTILSGNSSANILEIIGQRHVLVMREFFNGGSFG